MNKTRVECAFPSVDGMDNGMTLRDYFAAKAMQNLLVPESAQVILKDGIKTLAEAAYEIADAMLAERDK